MSYTRTIWKNGQTALNAENLNNIEEGLEELDQSVEKLKNSIPIGLPVVTIEDNGKHLEVVEGAWRAVEQQKVPESIGLPNVSAEDNGKVLGVSNGVWSVVEQSGGASSWHDLGLKSERLLLIPETETQFSYAPEDGLYMTCYTEVEKGYSAGDTGYFTVNGVSYALTASYLEGFAFFGNVNLANGTAPAEGEMPFLIAYSEESKEMLVFLYDADTSAEMRSYTIGLEVLTLEIVKIPKAYLPDELYTEIDSRIDAYIQEALGGEY